MEKRKNRRSWEEETEGADRAGAVNHRPTIFLSAIWGGDLVLGGELRLPVATTTNLYSPRSLQSSPYLEWESGSSRRPYVAYQIMMVRSL
jgi:hypothetical protein